MKHPLIIACVAVCTLASAAEAANRKIRLTGVPRSLRGATLLAVGSNGASTTVTISKSTVSVTPPASSTFLYVVDGGKVNSAVVVPDCSKKSGCKSVRGVSKVRTAIRAGATLSVRGESGILFVKNATRGNVSRLALRSSVVNATNAVPASIATRGLGSDSAQSQSLRPFDDSAVDSDADGLANQVDVDDDNDGTVDNYDSTTPAGSATTSFKVFSNFKLDIDQSLNLHTTGLINSRVNTAFDQVQTLAIQVLGESSDVAELDCGELQYCSAGGTGKLANSVTAFPGSAGGEFDTDSDGKGLIVKGSTNDFQLSTHATVDTIGAGDTFVQHVNEGQTGAQQVPGVLNFVFTSNPAVKEVAVNGGSSVAIDYAATPVLGSRQNCIQAPATGDVALTLIGYRPQRPGVNAAGEGEFVDLGSSVIAIDIPNAPCAGTNGCQGAGPGLCSGSSYSTSDTNLTLANGGIQDGKGDVDASSSNTYTFVVDLSGCLNNATNPVAWAAGETLFVDLQFRSRDGDNAAQKFCVTRAAS